MKKVLILFLLLFCGCKEAKTADVNVALTGTAAVSITAGIQTGAASNTNDDNEATSMQITGTGAAVKTADYTLTITFDDTYDLQRVEAVHNFIAVTTPSVTTYQVDLFYGGSWNKVLDLTQSATKITDTLNGEWDAVSAIRIDVRIQASDILGSPSLDCYTYELRAIQADVEGNYIISFL